MIFVSKLPFLIGYVVVKSSSMGISIICINHTLEDCGLVKIWLVTLELSSILLREEMTKILEDL